MNDIGNFSQDCKSLKVKFHKRTLSINNKGPNYQRRTATANVGVCLSASEDQH